jgi:dephospho-CoA kinase
LFCIALTGTIASGKSTVAALFKKLGVEIISADDVSKDITAPGEIAFNEIVKHFGPSILNAAGKLNRRALREIIYIDSQERLWLELLLHPLIRQRLEERKDQCISPYCIVEIPLLFKRESYPYINRVLLVTADQETRLQRIMLRDQHTREESIRIIASQAHQDDYQYIADDVITNNEDISELKRKITELHTTYLNFAIKASGLDPLHK